MNDRFKFRVWDKENKTYLDEDYLWLGSEGYAYDSQFQLSTIDFIIEQCTGLKDKNGNLIYEGDVVIGSWNTKLIVFWDDISASYMVKPLDKCGGDRELHYYSNMDGTLYYNFEIIGNVHEMEVEE